jgi:hypothetical protein
MEPLIDYLHFRDVYDTSAAALVSEYSIPCLLENLAFNFGTVEPP